MTEIPDETGSSRAPIPKGDETMWATFCHLGGLIGLLIPPGNIIIPLVIYLVYRDRYPFVADQGKEAINFQISFTIYMIVSGILVLIALGLVLLFALLIFDLIVTIMAALRASQGIPYRYPLSIRFLQ